MPNCGFLPHTSQTDAMARDLSEPRDAAGHAQPGNSTERERVAACRIRSQPWRSCKRSAPCDLRRVVSTYRDALRDHQDELNRLNVYPVPDGDTGTNMALTLESVVGELPATAPRTWQEVCEAIAPRLADGRAGQLGRDPLADPAGPRRHVRAARGGLRRATWSPGCAAPPTPPTRRCCARSRARSSPWCASAAEAVERARRRRRDRRWSSVLDRAAAAARDAVAQHARPAAGAAGRRRRRRRRARASRCCSTRASTSSTDGRSRSPRWSTTPASRSSRARSRGTATSSGAALRGHVLPRRRRRHDRRRSSARGAALGDSIVVVGGDGLWNCHVHTNDIGAAIEAGIDAGRPARHPRHRPARAGRGARRGGSGSREHVGAADGAPLGARHHRRGRGRGRRRARAPASRASACSRSSRAASR